MGVTYKAFDVDLHCSVTLKVITERYLDDESAQARFLREARTAARQALSTRGMGITRQSFRKMSFSAARAIAGEPPTQLGPEKISIASLPVTGTMFFGREDTGTDPSDD